MSPAAEKLSADAWKVIGVVILGLFMTQMDSTIVNVSLPAIKDSLLSSVSLSQWIITGYLLALALMLPLNAWLPFAALTLVQLLVIGAAVRLPVRIHSEVTT